MRLLTLALIGLLVLVQGGLWFGSGGWQATRKLRTQLAAAEQRNAVQRDRIARLQAEVDDLRQGLEMVEDRARGELGMIKDNEIFVQLTARR